MTEEVTALYHYTNISGLKGIIESNCLHATNIRYLNDSKEFYFGLDYFSKLFPYPDALSRAPDNQETSLYDHLIEALFAHFLTDFKSDRNAASEYFVVSFTRNPDLLSQWRAYGKENAGYCIKFNRTGLQYPISNPLDGMILKIEYIDPDDLGTAQKKLEDLKQEWKPEFLEVMPWLKTGDTEEYHKMLKRFLELEETYGNQFTMSLDIGGKSYPAKVDMNDPDPDWYTKIHEFIFFMLYPTLSTIACTWKHHSFREEDEYRLLSKRDENVLSTLKIEANIKFKEGRTLLVPYTEIQYDFKKKKIIEEVIVGPCPHPVEAASSVQQFLAVHLENAAEVVNSKVPYRLV